MACWKQKKLYATFGNGVAVMVVFLFLVVIALGSCIGCVGWMRKELGATVGNVVEVMVVFLLAGLLLRLWRMKAEGVERTWRNVVEVMVVFLAVMLYDFGGAQAALLGSVLSVLSLSLACSW